MAGGQFCATVALAALQTPSGAAAWQQAARQRLGRGLFVSGIYAPEIGLVLTGVLAGLKALAPQPRGVWHIASISRWLGRWLVGHTLTYCVPAAALAVVLHWATGPRVQVLPGVYAPGDAFPRCEHAKDVIMVSLGGQILTGDSLQEQCLPWAYPAAMMSLGSVLVAALGVVASFLARWLQHLSITALSRCPPLRSIAARLSFQRLSEIQYSRLEALADGSSTTRAASHSRGRSSRLAESQDTEDDDGSVRRRRVTSVADASSSHEAREAETASSSTAGAQSGVRVVFSAGGVTSSLFIGGFGVWLVLRLLASYGTEARTLSLDAGSAIETLSLIRTRPSMLSIGGAVLGGASLASLLAHRQLWQRAGRIRIALSIGAIILALTMLFADWYAMSLLLSSSALWRELCARLYGPMITLAWCGAIWGIFRLRLDAKLQSTLQSRLYIVDWLHWLAAGTVTGSLLQPPIVLGLLILSGSDNTADPALVALLALLAGVVSLILGALVQSLSQSLQSLLRLRHPQYPATVSERSHGSTIDEVGVLVSPFGTISGATGTVLVDALLLRSSSSSLPHVHLATPPAHGGSAQLERVLAELPESLRLMVTAPALTPADVAFLVGRATHSATIGGIFRVDLPGSVSESAITVHGGGAAQRPMAMARTGGDDDDDDDTESGSVTDTSEDSEEDDEDDDSSDDESGGASGDRFQAVARAMLAICSHPDSSTAAAEELSAICVAWEEETGATTQSTLELLRAAANEAAFQLADGEKELPVGGSLA